VTNGRRGPSATAACLAAARLGQPATRTLQRIADALDADVRLVSRTQRSRHHTQRLTTVNQTDRLVREVGGLPPEHTLAPGVTSYE